MYSSMPTAEIYSDLVFVKIISMHKDNDSAEAINHIKI